jgi:hypothetical protein
MAFMRFMVRLKYYDILTLCEFINWFMVLGLLGVVWTIR